MIDGTLDLRRRGDHGARPDRAVGQRDLATRCGVVESAEEQRRPAAISGLQRLQRADGSERVDRRNRVGGGPKRSGDGRLETRVDSQQVRNGARQTLRRILEQPRTAVVAFEAHRERLDPRGQRRDPLLRLTFGGLQRRNPLIRQIQRRDAPLVVFVEALLRGLHLAQ